MSESRATYWNFVLRHAIWVFFILLSSNSRVSCSVMTDNKNQNKDRNCVTDALQNVNINLMRQLVNQETLIRISMSKTITDMTNDIAVMKKALAETRTEMMAIKEENKRLREEVSKNEKEISGHNATFEETLTRQATLMKKVNAHTENIEALSVENKAFKEQISENKEGLADIYSNMTDNERISIAFHAILSSTVKAKAGTILKFAHVVTNNGNAYNPDTGKFVAPRAGTYRFDWSYLVHKGQHAFVCGTINGKRIQNTAISIQSDAYDMASGFMIVQLNKKDEVSLQTCADNTYLHANLNVDGFSFFGGHMI